MTFSLTNTMKISRIQRRIIHATATDNQNPGESVDVFQDAVEEKITYFLDRYTDLQKPFYS